MYPHGLSRTTVAELRARFAAKLRYAADTSDPEFVDDINEILEYLYSQADWRGNSGTWSLTLSDTGRVTLPYWLESIKAVRVDDRPRPIMSPHIEFLHNGPGDLEDTHYRLVVSDGEHPIETEFPASTSDTLGVASTVGADSDKSIRVYGLDQNGREVRTATGSSGVDIAVGTSSTQQFSAITGVVKPITRGRITLTLETATPLVLARYEATIKHPVYHRYKVNPVSDDSDTSVTSVVAWCSRRFIPVAKEEDFVCPGPMRAWKMAFYAQQMEEDADKKLGPYWAAAMEAFNADVQKYSRAELQTPVIQVYGPWISQIPRVY